MWLTNKLNKINQHLERHSFAKPGNVKRVGLAGYQAKPGRATYGTNNA